MSLSLGLFLSPALAVTLTFSVGILKEVYDQISYNGWSWGDIIANTLGVLLAFAILKIFL
jgi:glycopeptide antibiotics resistance protein